MTWQNYTLPTAHSGFSLLGILFAQRKHGRMFQMTFFSLVTAEAEPEPLTWEERDKQTVQAWGKYVDERLEENPDFFFTDGHTDMGDVS